ncbi:DUF6325 family protein [Actinomadura rudentiformis]|uniref:DUF1269 domain-containing protein n=1 Tax=Actinomadura rudentiformis TaxID=359158 RepID=A0A6H9YET4_9ACTN|nr:DUF6325 family protein [Actinomadura rudentiformis]KAB2344414.1 hypothetical protein F8566_31275 [Actinomadura rudentiformis]
MTWGPLEFLVLSFPGPAPGKGAVSALTPLRAGGVEVVDTLLVTKAPDGTVQTTELADLPEFHDLTSEHDLIAVEDAEEVAAGLDPGTCALAVLVEHSWAKEAAATIKRAGGRLAASIRIPADHIPEKT